VYKRQKEFFVPSGYKVYEQQHAIYDDFSRGTYYINQQKYEELKAFRVQSGDLIISCSGTVGRAAVVPPAAEPGIINQALLKLTFNPGIILTRFFQILFAERLEGLLRENVRGSAMVNITGVKDLKAIPWPVPPLGEQLAIVEEVDKLLSLGECLAKDVEGSCHRANQLRQSILKRAFQGKLVPQDPTDEPASVLLERIREHGKESIQQDSKGQRKRRVTVTKPTRGSKT